MYSHPNTNNFDNQTMTDYESFRHEYDRFEEMDYSIAYQLIQRNILDNACRESIVFLGEDGTMESCALLEKLLSEIRHGDVQKWLQVALIHSESYLHYTMKSNPDIEGDILGDVLVFTGLGSFDGMMRILVGFQIAQMEAFLQKNDIKNINALFELSEYHAKIESFEIRGDHVLYSLGVDMQHAPTDPIEKMIEYFNVPQKTLFHKYYCNNTNHPDWEYWVNQLQFIKEKS